MSTITAKIDRGIGSIGGLVGSIGSVLRGEKKLQSPIRDLTESERNDRVLARSSGKVMESIASAPTEELKLAQRLIHQELERRKSQ